MKLFFYFLVAYLPFQLALNLSGDVDLLSGRVLILALFVVWAARCFKNHNLQGRLFVIPSPARAGRGISRVCEQVAPVCTGDSSPAVLRGRNDIVCVGCENNGDSLIIKNRLSLAIMAFFILAAISLLAAQNQIWGGRKLLVFASIFPLFFLARSIIKTEAVFKKTLWIIIIGAALNALIALGQFLAQFVFSRQTIVGFYGEYIGPHFWGAAFSRLVLSDPSWFVAVSGRTLMRAIGLFPDPHMLAFYLGIVSPLVLGMLLFSGDRKKILFGIYCLLLFVLLLTFSRGGYLGVAASLTVFFTYGWQRLAAGGRKFILGFLGAALVLAGVIGAPLTARFFSSFNLSEGSNFGRLGIWRESLVLAEKNLILGVGLGNYSLAVGGDVYRSAATSHNAYLDIFVETGIFGLAAWLFIFLAALNELRKRIINFKMPLDIFGINLGLLVALVYFLVHSFFETPIFNPTILAMLMIILGMASTASKLFIIHDS